MVDTVNQWGSGLLIVGGALLCGLLILVGGVVLAVLRTGIIGDLLAGLGGTVGAYEDTAEPRTRRVPRAGSARARAQSLRAQYDREFDAQVGGPSVPSDAGFDHPDLDPVADPPSGRDSALGNSASSSARNRRRRSEFDDFEDEMDAFFDDTEL